MVEDFLVEDFFVEVFFVEVFFTAVAVRVMVRHPSFELGEEEP